MDPLAAHQAHTGVLDETQPYEYETLSEGESFRVIELHPGQGEDPVVCRLRITGWHEDVEYETISYTWGDPKIQTPLLCNGSTISVSNNLYLALRHLRYRDRVRIMWADALCINQKDIHERSLQVRHMKKIYQKAHKVEVWLGPDNEERYAASAVRSVRLISDFLAARLNIDILDESVQDSTFQELLLESKGILPSPGEANYGSTIEWEPLVWLFPHKYFTRIWVIQEISANSHREVNIGFSKTAWNRLDLVASYIIMDPDFADAHGFSNAHCWWVATIAELTLRPERWLDMLYLASNYQCMDPRDVIFGLRGLMLLKEGDNLLFPDYEKTVKEVYRDAVEAVLVNFKNVNVLLYVSGIDSPSWIPRWDHPMLFRNPFRFGRPVSWRPAGETEAVWSVDSKTDILLLTGYVVGTITHAATYNQRWFSDSLIDSVEGKALLSAEWTDVLQMLKDSRDSRPIDAPVWTTVAKALSFNASNASDPSQDEKLRNSLLSYLSLVFAGQEHTLIEHDLSPLLQDVDPAEGHAFGKPVWDFQYPDSSVFVSREAVTSPVDSDMIGCAVATTQPGDVVFVALGSTYPMILRPVGESERLQYIIRGFAYVDAIMHGGFQQRDRVAIEIC